MKEFIEIITELQSSGMGISSMVCIIIAAIAVAGVFTYVTAKAKTLGERKKEEKENVESHKPKTITVQVNDNKTVINNYIVINNVCDLDVYELIKKQVEELESKK